MMLLSEPENLSPKKRYWPYVLIALLLTASGTYFLMLGPADHQEPDTSPTTEPLPVPRAVPTEPVPTAVLTEPEPIRGDPDITETPLPTLDPSPAVKLDPVFAPSVIVLQVTADVDEADVFIDRQYVGTTPFESAALAPGRYRVTVSASGFETHAEDVDVTGTPTSIMVTFKQVYLDERTVVVHKHRFGDCVGELVASTSGIRYQTSDDDAFEVALDALEEFEVDYLEHNLRIKVRGGRTYNFTDDQDNADALFVFHRQVENARNRLALGYTPVLP